MIEFKPGDQVFLVEEYGGFDVGDVGVVQKLTGNLVTVKMGYKVDRRYGEVADQMICYRSRLRLANPISLEDQIKDLLG
jgi:hypothetical protein